MYFNLTRARFPYYGEKSSSSSIYFNEDLCPASQEIVKSKFPLTKQARADGKIAYFKLTKLIIKERMNRVQLVRATGSSPSGGEALNRTYVHGDSANIGGFVDFMVAVP